MADLVGTRELARRLGVTAPAVSRAVREGRLQPAATKDGRKLYDVEEARRKWAPLSASPAPAPPPPSPEEDDVPGANASDNERYAKARADKTEAEAAQEGLKLAEMEKSLLSREELVLSFTSCLRVAGQGFSGLPARLLSRFPGLTPAGRDFLATEIRAILDDLAKWEPEA